MISIVIPSVERVHSAFLECIPSLLRHGAPDEVVLVDDGSGEDLPRTTEDRCRRSGVRLLALPTNRGYAAAANRGIAAARGDIVCLVNTDVRFVRPVLGRLLRAFEDGRVGVVGGLLEYPDGRIQHAGIERRGRYFVHRGYRGRLADHPTLAGAGPVLACTGALLAIRRSALGEIGRFDEGMALGSEDVDFCLRAWGAGWRVVYDPGVRAVHHEGKTRGRSLGDKLGKSVSWTWRELRSVKRLHAKRRLDELRRLEAHVASARRAG